MCALLVSVITLSGAANRSFHTTLEQWNPIGFTQAPSGSPITNRLTAGSAILPTVATAAPSGVLRSGSTNVITFTTAKAVGEEITFYMVYSGDKPTLSGATRTPESWKDATYTLTSQTVTITGDVTYFLCSKNQLTALDVSNDTALTWLDCSGNQLTALDVSKNTALTTLDCYHNQLTALDVSKNTALTNLDCSNNQLTALDVSKNTALTTLTCFKNQLTTLDVPQHTALEKLDCYNNQLTTLDVSQNTALTMLSCNNNQLKVLDVSQNIALTELFCSGNQLTALDVSKNTALTWLNCSGNQLTTLDVSKKNTALTTLDCSDNLLTALDVSKNTKLIYLECSNNQLKALNVSQNTALGWLYCDNNQLKALDVSKNTALTDLGCRGNQIKGEEMTRLVNSLPDLTGKEVGSFIVVHEPDPEGNICLKSDVAIAKGKNWKTLKYKSDTKKVVSYEGEEASPNVITFTTANAVGEVISLYMNYSGDKPTLSGATGTPESGKYVTYTLTSQTVTITGNVTFLYCSGNQLKALDVSKNTALTRLYCFSNQIKGEEMTRLVNSLPDRTGKAAGEIVVVQSDAESNRCLKSDVAIAKSKNWNTLKYNTDIHKTVPYEGEEPIPYAVTLTKEGEGTLTATEAADLTAVLEGTELTIVATPADGYELKALTANGTDILATKKFTVTANTEVKATFTKKTAADVVESSSVRLYPNPASTYVNVKGAKADALVRLYDTNGALRYEARTDADGTLQIDLSAYAEGAYLLRMGDDAQRLLIQR